MANYQLTSIASIIQRLGQRTDGADTNVFWTEAEKLDAINEGLRFWQALTGQWQQEWVMPITASPFQPVPRQFASIYRVSYNGVPLPVTSLYELDTSFGAWQGVSGTPRFWAPCGVNEFALYPYPTSGTLTIVGYQDLPIYTNGMYINIGNEELTYVLDYARHFLAFKEGQGELDATLPGVERLVAAAALKNSRLTVTNTYKRYMGLDREEGERPLANGQVIGVRGVVQ